ncbi:MAG: hypothetical protein LUC90_00725 [Lachnospiraceae bacterium]|nr:hypothetical protein [Lachnospiraceae bacterium]
MKYNILTFLAAALMVIAATTALSSGMWIYEQNQLDTEEMRTPTTISNSIGTIYSDSAQDDGAEDGSGTDSGTEAGNGGTENGTGNTSGVAEDGAGGNLTGEDG